MNNPLLFIICLLFPLQVISAPSAVSFYSVSISLERDTLEKIIEIRGVQGSDRLLSRIIRGFNPETQQVSLDRAVFGFPGGETGPVPEWAVDTLTGAGEWPLALVTAFPALQEGMSIDYRITVSDWSGNWRRGVWMILSPSVKGLSPDTCIFSFTGDMIDELKWQGTGYEIENRYEELEFTAGDSSGMLVISPFSDYGDLEEFLLWEASDILDSTYPPDLREAALQATSAGADEFAQSARARTLLCNSMNWIPNESGSDVTGFNTLQQILDRRRGTSLEIALVYAAMCRELGMSADILPASEIDYGIPIPAGWNRFLVKLSTDDSAEWLMEPSAFLTPASYIHRPDTLYCIDNGAMRALPPIESSENRIVERWSINCTDGTFNLEIDCSGWYDMKLRRILAGLSPEKTLLALSQWSWLSGRNFNPDSFAASDPYDLHTAMRISVFGKLWIPAVNSISAEYLPVLDWSQPQDMPDIPSRTWTLSGAERVFSTGSVITEIIDDTVILYDTSGIEDPLPIVFEVAD